MKSFALITFAACSVLCAADPQHTYDGRDGPHVFGKPGNQVYIRGQNEGAYSVPGVGGQFQNSPSQGVHSYTDEQGNTFVNRKIASGPGSHTISGPGLTAQNGGYSDSSGGLRRGPSDSSGGLRRSRSPHSHDGLIDSSGGLRSAPSDSSGGLRSAPSDSSGGLRSGPSDNSGGLRRSRSPHSHDGLSDSSGGLRSAPSDSSGGLRSAPSDSSGGLRSGSSDSSGGLRRSRSPQFHVERPDRTVDFGNGQFHIQRNRRSPQIAVVRPDRGVYVGNGGVSIQRYRRSPQIHVARPDRTVDIGPQGFVIQRHRRSPARVQGENFVARDDQAGIWNNNVSVWKRPDGRTVTVDQNGHTTVSGRRGTQHYN